jgi:xylulokinase
MEGVAFSLRDSLTVFAELEVPVAAIRLGGGGARSKLWRQIQADIFGQAVETVQADEGAALGAGLLAGVGIGVWPDVDGACHAVVRTAEHITPRPAVAAFMDERYKHYRRVYPALQSLCGALCAPTYA